MGLYPQGPAGEIPRKGRGDNLGGLQLNSGPRCPLARGETVNSFLSNAHEETATQRKNTSHGYHERRRRIVLLEGGTQGRRLAALPESEKRWDVAGGEAALLFDWRRPDDGTEQGQQ